MRRTGGSILSSTRDDSRLFLILLRLDGRKGPPSLSSMSAEMDADHDLITIRLRSFTSFSFLVHKISPYACYVQDVCRMGLLYGRRNLIGCRTNHEPLCCSSLNSGGPSRADSGTCRLMLEPRRFHMQLNPGLAPAACKHHRHRHLLRADGYKPPWELSLVHYNPLLRIPSTTRVLCRPI